MAEFKGMSMKFSIVPPKVKLDTKQTKAKLKESRAALNRVILKTTAYMEKFIPMALDETLTMKQYPWPRAGGNPEAGKKGSPRVINLSGALRNSLSVNTKYLQTKTTLTIKYSSPYANLVYYGGMIQPYGNRYAASVLLPGRPWIEDALKAGGPFDFEAEAHDQFNKMFGEEF